MGGRRARAAVLPLLLAGLAPPLVRAQGDGGPRLVGLLQTRLSYASAIGLTGSVNRARVGVTGSVGSGFSYVVTIEAADTPAPYSTTLRDALIRWTRGGLGVTVGQFKTPFSRAFLEPLTVLPTADYAAVVTSLVPKRDIGVMADYDWHARVGAALGVFNGEGLNAGVNSDSSAMVVARVTARPVDAVRLGADVARSRDSTRYGFEAGLVYRSVELRGEYVRQHDLGIPADDVGWFVTGIARLGPALDLVAQQEDLQEPAVASFVRNTATTLGVDVFLDGGRERLLANYVSRRVGTRSGALVLQAQISLGKAD